jgi:hypothetical protein
MMERVNDNLDVNMNFTNAQDHVPEAEWNNQTIKERIRAAYHRLPYKALPRIMIRYLAMYQVNQLNLFPVKGGVSVRVYYSPRMILNQENLDYAKHCYVPFGAYVQANHETNRTNSNATRTLNAIYLRSAQNQQGGHELMDLDSGQVITRNIVHGIPVTDVVIKAVETMAYEQGFKNMKFKNRNGVVFFDTDWIAGVDYEEDDIEDDGDEDAPYRYEAEQDENMEYANIDPEEVDDLNQDIAEHYNPNVHQQNGNEEVAQPDNPEQLPDAMIVSDAEDENSTATKSTRTSTRETKPIERLEPAMTGKLYT